MASHVFENSTITKFGVEQDSVVIEIQIEPEKIEKYSITVLGARLIACDIASLADLRMEAEDGEVIHLEYTDTELEVIIEWNQFVAPRKQWTKYYRISGATISIDRAKCGIT